MSRPCSQVSNVANSALSEMIGLQHPQPMFLPWLILRVEEPIRTEQKARHS